jgi:hypothetical protein
MKKDLIYIIELYNRAIKMSNTCAAIAFLHENYLAESLLNFAHKTGNKKLHRYLQVKIDVEDDALNTPITCGDDRISLRNTLIGKIEILNKLIV